MIISEKVIIPAQKARLLRGNYLHLLEKYNLNAISYYNDDLDPIRDDGVVDVIIYKQEIAVSPEEYESLVNEFKSNNLKPPLMKIK